MNILYCGDENTQRGIMLSVLTLLEHVREPLCVYMLTMSYQGRRPVSRDFASRIGRLVRGKGGQSRLIDCTDMFAADPPVANLGTRFTPYCMLRLYSDLVPGLPGRILYLDYDVVCQKDCSEFYHQPLEGVEFVGVPDYYGRWFYSRMRPRHGRYLNSGVLLMNLDEIRKTGLMQKCRDLCRRKRMFLPDQHALNLSAVSARIAPRRYNDQRRTHPDTVFRHYSTTWRAFPWAHTVSVKPWQTAKMHKQLKDYSLDKTIKIMEREMTRRTTIPVFFTIDDNYAPWLAVAINSIIRGSSTEKYDYHITVLHQGISEEHIRRISSLSKEHFEIEFLPMKETFDGIEADFMGNKLRADYFTLTIYFRIFIPDMFPQYDKGIYLDSDIVVPGDLSKLYEVQLGDNLIAACPDYSIQEIPPFVEYVEKYVGVDKAIEYINSGILLMNLGKLREAHLGTRFLELLNKYHFDSIAPDQDYFNALCKGKIVFLGPEWDAMPNDNHPELEAPQLIHYNLFAKPWCYDGIQYAGYFWRYAETSGYIDEIRHFKDNYSPEQKASDSESIKRMGERGAMLSARAEGSFRQIFDSGAERRL